MKREIKSIQTTPYDNGASTTSYYKGETFPGMGLAFINGERTEEYMKVVDIVQPFEGKDVYDVIFNDGSFKRFQQYVRVDFSNRVKAEKVRPLWQRIFNLNF